MKTLRYDIDLFSFKKIKREWRFLNEMCGLGVPLSIKVRKNENSEANYSDRIAMKIRSSCAKKK